MKDYISKEERLNSFKPDSVVKRFIRISLVMGLAFLLAAFLGAEFWNN